KRRRGASIRDVHHLSAGQLLEQHRAQMRSRAVALRGERDLTWVGLHIVDELCRGLGWECRLDQEHVRHCAEHDHGLEFRGLKGKLLIEVVVDRYWSGRACEQHVPIRGLARDGLCTDIPASSRTVVDDYRLAPLLGELLRDDAR